MKFTPEFIGIDDSPGPSRLFIMEEAESGLDHPQNQSPAKRFVL